MPQPYLQGCRLLCALGCICNPSFHPRWCRQTSILTGLDAAVPVVADPQHAQVIFVETVSNPLTSVADLDAVVAFAKKHGLVSMVDNTFASPCICR